MSSDLYTIRCLSRDEATGAVRMKVTSLPFSDELIDSRQFFLVALCESSDMSPFEEKSHESNDPITKRITYSQCHDEEFLDQHAKEYISSVLPIESSYQEPEDYEENLCGESMEYLVQVTDPALTAHLTEEKEWGTTQYY